jgi:hypothetical protein
MQTARAPPPILREPNSMPIGMWLERMVFLVFVVLPGNPAKSVPSPANRQVSIYDLSQPHWTVRVWMSTVIHSESRHWPSGRLCFVRSTKYILIHIYLVQVGTVHSCIVKIKIQVCTCQAETLNLESHFKTP